MKSCGSWNFRLKFSRHVVIFRKHFKPNAIKTSTVKHFIAIFCNTLLVLFEKSPKYRENYGWSAILHLIETMDQFDSKHCCNAQLSSLFDCREQHWSLNISPNRWRTIDCEMINRTNWDVWTWNKCCWNEKKERISSLRWCIKKAWTFRWNPINFTIIISEYCHNFEIKTEIRIVTLFFTTFCKRRSRGLTAKYGMSHVYGWSQLWLMVISVYRFWLNKCRFIKLIAIIFCLHVFRLSD